MVLLLALYSFGGLALAAFSVPLVLRRIPPNGFYGFRLRGSSENPQIWYKINAFAGRRMVVVGLGTAIGAIILYYTIAHDLERYALSCLGLFLALFLWAMISSFLYLRALEE